MPMNETFETYTFPSADGTSRCCGIAVLPNDEPRALMLISHGMAEHVKRYLPFMRALAACGILAFGHDHIGHGASVSAESDLGYLPRKNGADVLVTDVIRDAERFRGCYPDVPLILFGHSMGSFVARIAAASSHASLFDAMVLSGTGSKNPLSPIAMAVLSVLCTIRGEKAHSKTMLSMMFDPYSAHFEKRTSYDWLTTDTNAVDRYIADPLCGFPLFTVSGLYVLTKLLHDANAEKTCLSTPEALPILLISGRDDPVGNMGDGIHEVADAYTDAGCTCVSHTLYTGARHELLNEPIAAQVITELLAWIDRNLNVLSKRSTPT